MKMTHFIFFSMVLFSFSANASAPDCKRAENYKTCGSLLLHACMVGDIVAAKDLVANGVDINYRNLASRTPLMVAIKNHKNHYAKITEMLIRLGADVNATDEGGMTALLFASISKDVVGIKALLAAGANVNAIEIEDGSSVLFFASCAHSDADRVHSQEAVNLLIKAGAKVNATDYQGWSALFCAANSNSVEVVSDLIKAGADVKALNDEHETPLHRAAANNKKDVVEELINAGVDVNMGRGDWRSAINLAARYNPSAEVMSVLIQRGAQLESVDRFDGETPLLAACAFNSSEVIKTLMKSGVNILAVGKSVSDNCITKLSRRNRPEMIPVISELLQAGLEIGYKNNFGEDALYYSAEEKSVAVAAALIQAGANVHSQTNYGRTALLNACEWSSDEMVTYLINAGSNPNLHQTDHSTPLMFASAYNSLKAVEALIAAGADVNSQNDSGQTALSLAKAFQRADIVKSLILNGAHE